MATVYRVATCNLNQWALDFDGNFRRILESCRVAKERGCVFRTGPELEIPGYGCEDHFLESDTEQHAVDSLASLLDAGATDGLLCDFGLNLRFESAQYNCRVFALNRRILLIRPKMALADNGNYRESRYFAQWPRDRSSATMLLPARLRAACAGQADAPFGYGCVQLASGLTIGSEICEELWSPDAPHVDQALRGVDVIANPSGSHHQLRKLAARCELVIAATRRCGGTYLYANSRGCDGGRLYFDGCALVAQDGELLAQGSQFSLKDVEVVVADVDVDRSRSFRSSLPSLAGQAAMRGSSRLLVVRVADALPRESEPPSAVGTQPISLRVHTPEEECCFGPACWLWDYLRRSGAGGYFLPLSGGMDSAATATIVFAMCEMACSAMAEQADGQVAKDWRRIGGGAPPPAGGGGDGRASLAMAKQVANRVFHTCYLRSENSSAATQRRASGLAQEIGSYHTEVCIDGLVREAKLAYRSVSGREPEFMDVAGKGTVGDGLREDLALQNVQARSRMLLSYLFAQLLPGHRGTGKYLLVLGSANVDEALRGYMTKYDCSSADLNPIGGISKLDLRRMLLWAAGRYELHTLRDICSAPPTAELRPAGDGQEHSQTDEEDMGFSYEELGVFGRLRKVERCGPVSMMRRLLGAWRELSPAVIADKVKRFFRYYGINRHKLTTLTPAYHAEQYSPDDNRFDLRQFLYNIRWDWQFRDVDRLADAARRKRGREEEPVAATAGTSDGAAATSGAAGKAANGAASRKRQKHEDMG